MKDGGVERVGGRGEGVERVRCGGWVGDAGKELFKKVGVNN